MTGKQQEFLNYESLVSKKDELEREISRLEAILTANNTNMTNSLIDLQGFPRSDIDVYTVRHTRSKIIHLSNDHADILKEIEKSLIQIHSQAKVQGPGSFSSFEDLPFAKIDGVAPDSPASLAGLERDDLLVNFGDLSTKLKSTSQTFDLLGNAVQARIGLETVVKVQRRDVLFVTKLTPRNWGGKGVLGCHLIPLK
jgi:26S proteasome non-ATPase regulatory subunit 9